MLVLLATCHTNNGPPLGTATKSSPKLSIDHSLNWLKTATGLVLPHVPVFHWPEPQPEPATNTSKPEPYKYVPTVFEPPPLPVWSEAWAKVTV